MGVEFKIQDVQEMMIGRGRFEYYVIVMILSVNIKDGCHKTKEKRSYLDHEKKFSIKTQVII